jgi:long-chain acyl-CoA synthetase
LVPHRDLGKVDEDGYVYIVDAKKDLIIVGGQNVLPTGS